VGAKLRHFLFAIPRMMACCIGFCAYVMPCFQAKDNANVMNNLANTKRAMSATVSHGMTVAHNTSEDSQSCNIFTFFEAYPGSLCSPNEDFRRANQPFRTRFRSTFQRFVAQILYSHPQKVLRKSILKRSSDSPKSSFGRCKVPPPDGPVNERSAGRL